MAKTLQEKRQERMKLVKDQRALLDKASAEARDFTGDEKTSYENLDGQVERLTTEITREERLVEREREMAAAAGPDAERGTPTPPAGESRGTQTPEQRKEVRAAFDRFLRGGPVTPELRALSADVDTQGGALVAPMEFTTELIKAIDNETFMRAPGMATVKPLTKAGSLGAASLDADPADADWTSEIATGNEDSSMAFGGRELTPHPLAKRIKISNKLLRLAAMGAESLVLERLGYKFGVTQEKGFFTGDGASKPLGIFVASASGISTGRDISTGSATAITADSLIDAKYGLKSGYQAKARWIFHRDVIKAIRKLKDGQNQYLWQPGLAGGQPDRILDTPFYMSEYAPNTFTTGLYLGIIGDFSYYWIAEALTVQIQRLTELYAETNQTGFIGRMELDGMPVLEEAFSRIKTA